METPQNLIAQIYDGIKVVSGEKGSVQQLIKQKYP